MKFCLKENWAKILQRAWSIRFMGIAAILSGLEAGLPFAQHLGYAERMPGGVFALLTIFVVAAAFIARLVAQNNLQSYRGTKEQNAKRRATAKQKRNEAHLSR